MLNRETARAFGQWCDDCALRLLLLNAVTALRNRELKLAVLTWTAYVDERAEALRQLRWGLQRLLFFQVGLAFGTWSAWLQTRQTGRVAPRRALAHWCSMRVVHAMGRWESLVCKRALLRRAVGALMHAKVRPALSTWSAYVGDVAASRTALHAVARRFSAAGRTTSRALNSWRTFCESVGLLRRAASLFVHHDACRALRKWASVRAVGAALRAMLGRMRHLTLGRAWQSWLSAPTEPTPAVKRRAVSRFRHRPLAKAFDTWLEWSDEQQLLRRGGVRLVKRSLGRAWASWEALCDAHYLMASAASALLHTELRRCALSRQNSPATVAQRSVTSTANTSRASPSALIHRGLSSWLERLVETATARERLGTSLLSLVMTGLRAAMNSWADAATSRAERGEALSRVTALVVRRGAARAWTRWCDALAACECQQRARVFLVHHAVVAALDSWQEHVEYVHLLRRAARSFVAQAHRRAFNSWTEGVAARTDELRRTSGVRAAMATIQQLRAFNALYTHATEAAMARRALASFQSSGTARAWSSWVALAEAQRAQAAHRPTALRAALRASSGLRAGWLTWTEVVRERRLTLLAVRALVDGGRRRAFGAWTASVDAATASCERRFAAYHRRRLSARRKAWGAWGAFLAALAPLARAASRKVRYETGRALGSWRARVATSEVTRGRHVHVARFRVARHLWRWRAGLGERERVRAVLAGLRRSGLRRTLRRWSRAAEEREAKLSKMRSTLQVLSGHHRVLKALNSWKATLRDGARRLRATTALHRHVAFHGFRAWLAAHIHERFVVAAQAHWRCRGCLGAHRRWARVVPRLARQRLAAAYFGRNAILAGMRAWLGRLERVQMLALALAAFGHLSTRRAFRDCRAKLAARAALSRRQQRHAGQLRALERRRIFRRWQAASSAATRRRALLDYWRSNKKAKALNWMRLRHAYRAHSHGVGRRLQRRRLGCAYRAWRVVCAGGRRSRRLGAAFVDGLRVFRCERKALRAWVGFAGARRKLERLVVAFRGPVRARLLRGASFGTWKSSTRRPPSQPLGAPSHLRTIRAMTWRECCTWLNSVGIRVSRSPPALLRVLRLGSPYNELVRRIAPPFWVRHKLAHVHDPRTLFCAIQQLFDTERVVTVVGCQRLDVGELVSGRALEHLELLASLRELFDANLDAELSWAANKKSPSNAAKPPATSPIVAFLASGQGGAVARALHAQAVVATNPGRVSL